MSNPGVKYLTETKLTNGKDLRIEDNIGEAIHIHYDEFRLDFSISEFIRFSEELNDSLNILIDNNEFKVESFDPLFLFDIADKLVDLNKIEYTTINLENLKVQKEGFLGLPVISGLKESRVYKALKGETDDYYNYKQTNYVNQLNSDRLGSVLKSIEENGYPYKNQYIILFNNQDMIRDGQHRASSLLFLKGNIEVPVIRIHFNKNKHNTSNYPWIEALFKWNKKRVIGLLRKIYRFFKKNIRRTLGFIKRKLKIASK
jgi:hypothetical protein